MAYICDRQENKSSIDTYLSTERVRLKAALRHIVVVQSELLNAYLIMETGE